MPIFLEQEALTDLLQATREQSLLRLDGLDPHALDAAGQPLWCVLAELTALEHALLAAVTNHASGRPGACQPLLDGTASAAATTPLSSQQHWQTARAALIVAIHTLPFEALHTPLAGSTPLFISELVKRLIGHEQRRIQQLLAPN